MTGAQEKIIEVRHLGKQFGKFTALENVTFDVFKGDVFGFLGPNGAGKSTTIRSILTLVTQDAGSIRLFGLDNRKHRNQVLGRIGCIVEKPDFYKYLSAEKNLEISARLSGLSANRKQIHEYIEFVGLKGRERDKLSGFSHGMKQRLGIAQTLLHDPELIILDEPTTGLDPQGIIDIRNLILNLKSEYGKTVLLSSHILSEIELIANRMVIINKGKTVVQGNVHELLNSGELVVSLETDQISEAMGVLKEKGFHPMEQEAPLRVNVAVNREQVPEVIQILTEAGIHLFSVESKRKLEDYFLKLISE